MNIESICKDTGVLRFVIWLNGSIAATKLLYPEIISYIQELRYVITEAEECIDFLLKPVHFRKNLILQDALRYERFNILR